MFRLLFCALVVTSAVFAQTASITGRVTDPHGAVVPGVHVTALSRDSGVAAEANTNQEGYYNLSSLQPGSYNLSLTKSGFAEVREENLVLEVQQVARIDFKLKLGSDDGEGRRHGRVAADRVRRHGDGPGDSGQSGVGVAFVRPQSLRSRHAGAGSAAGTRAPTIFRRPDQLGFLCDQRPARIGQRVPAGWRAEYGGRAGSAV